MKEKHSAAKFAAYLYAFLQVILLFFLRKMFLMTVYQTVLFYGCICLTGVLLTIIPAVGKLSNLYVVLWSGIHGVIVLGFLTCGTFYLTLTQVTFVQIVNLFLGVTLYWFCFLASGKITTAVDLGNVLIGVIGGANYYLMRFRGAPFSLSDIKAARTAGNVIKSYDFEPGILLVVAITDLILWSVVCHLSMKESRVSRRNGWAILISAGIVLGCISLPLMKYDKVYAQTMQFSQDTYLAGLLAEMLGGGSTLPDDYRIDEVERVAEKFERDAANRAEYPVGNADVQRPNIVVIMNEAFSDLRVLGDVKTDQPVLAYWESLRENVIRGYANVSVLGGTTANSEYEFLSSDAVGIYGNVIPYNSYFRSTERYPGLVSNLKEQGYEAMAFHPYLSSGWNRTQVYRAMQFDHIIFEENLSEQLDTLRIYTSDKGDYSYIEKWFSEKRSSAPQFIFNVTMQNHGGYTYSGGNFETTVHLLGDAEGKFPQAEQYLSLVKASDEALKGLLDFFAEYEEPVIVVMFGDHQPRLEDDFYEYITGKPINSWTEEERMKQYKTPFIIWHNYETQGKDIGDVSVNYLGALLMQDAGLELSNYQDFVITQYQAMPVITGVGLKDKDGKIYPKGTKEYAELTADYRLMVYNHTADKDNRLEKFYNLRDRVDVSE